MTARAEITGLILAGGRAQRMGGIDKGLVPFMGKPLIEHAIDRLTPQVASILINANRNQDHYAQYGHAVIADHHPDFAGPLAGFAAGLEHCNTEYLLSVPCDSPVFPLNLSERMVEVMINTQSDLVYASSSDPSGAIWTQPVFCLMRRSVKKSLQNFLEHEGRKIDRWFETLRSSTVVFIDESAFANTNTPEELQTLEQTLQGSN
ncbi:MAG: molybdenum cofactor guanylyltransferase [Pseudomonadota bacterium]|jgi:molybdopterin-guanine dinucleotide biosynthesis protein A